MGWAGEGVSSKGFLCRDDGFVRREAVPRAERGHNTSEGGNTGAPDSPCIRCRGQTVQLQRSGGPPGPELPEQPRRDGAWLLVLADWPEGWWRGCQYALIRG